MIVTGDAIVVAGGTGRVGGATIGALARAGARLLVLSRSAESALRAIDAADGARSAAEPYAVDLTDAAAGEAAIGHALERFGRIDAVVSLAGGGHRFTALLESTSDDLAASVAGNLTTAYNLMLPALRAMLRQPFREGARSRGRLVAVTAGSSRDPQPRFALMGAAKAGVNVLMQGIAREHKADGIVANAVVLGAVATEAAPDYLSDADFEAAARPEEVADVLAFLASDRSSGINGALVELNARETD